MVTCKYSLNCIQNCGNFGFLDYILTLKIVGKNGFEYLGAGRGEDSEVHTFGGRVTSKTYRSIHGGGGIKIN